MKRLSTYLIEEKQYSYENASACENIYWHNNLTKLLKDIGEWEITWATATMELHDKREKEKLANGNPV